MRRMNPLPLLVVLAFLAPVCGCSRRAAIPMDFLGEGQELVLWKRYLVPTSFLDQLTPSEQERLLRFTNGREARMAARSLEPDMSKDETAAVLGPAGERFDWIYPSRMDVPTGNAGLVINAFYGIETFGRRLQPDERTVCEIRVYEREDEVLALYFRERRLLEIITRSPAQWKIGGQHTGFRSGQDPVSVSCCPPIFLRGGG